MAFDIEEIREMVHKEVEAELHRREKLSRELNKKEFKLHDHVLKMIAAVF